MEPPSYVWFVVDRKFVMRCIPVSVMCVHHVLRTLTDAFTRTADIHLHTCR